MPPHLIFLAILAVPLFSAAFIACFLRRRGLAASLVSVGAAFVIMGLSLYFLINWDGIPFHGSIRWLILGPLTVNMGILFDGNAAIMLLVVSCVGFLIHLFSMGYMDSDKAQGRFFAGLSIFMFSMLGIVFADNLIMLFIFWELVGFSSYALIAHYSDTQEASLASKKAFIVNRVGDFGFLVGIVWVYWQFDTVDLELLSQKADIAPGSVSIGIALLLMCGFLGKSAQFPLQVWLPDAMAGPTPVSALIHAATMVAAGIYFIVRIYFLFPQEVLTVILYLGSLMTVYAGLCALVQNDIKKILAYSTLAQLGYMATALGLGLPGLALFHLATHACFKALLFLGAGSVIHALHHEQNIFKMGGLFKKMPITAITFAIGVLALSGVTYTSGFFSKDAIIEAAFLNHKSFFYVVLFSAFLTAIYMGRLFWITFLGQSNSAKAKGASESSWVMVTPLMLLAILSLTVGFTFLWPKPWSISFLSEYEHIHTTIQFSGFKYSLLVLSIGTWLFGFALTYFFYGLGAKKDNLNKKWPVFFNLLKSKLWFDVLYNAYVSKVQQRFAELMGFVDTVFITGILVRGTAGVVGVISLLTKSVHIGNVHAYVYWFLSGVVLFGAFAFGWF